MITRDNVPVSIDGVLFFTVVSVEDAVMKIQDYAYAIKQLALTALRDVVGGVTLDELLAERERVGKMVQEIVGKQAQEWGLEVTGIRLQQIDMPEELKKIMSRQAAAEREKRATITKAVTSAGLVKPDIPPANGQTPTRGGIALLFLETDLTGSYSRVSKTACARPAAGPPLPRLIFQFTAAPFATAARSRRPTRNSGSWRRWPR